MNALDFLDSKIKNNYDKWEGLNNLSDDKIIQLMEEYAELQTKIKSLQISEILDKYLPPNGVGTEREELRMNLHNEICRLMNK